MELYIQGKDHGRIKLNLVENNPLIWTTVAQEDGTVRLKTYKELSDKEKLQAHCDLKATNIVLQGLSLDVYALVNHHKIAKDIWDRVKLLMQGTSLSKQERECKLYDEFDKFSYVKGTDISKITRKQSKTSKHGHKNQKDTIKKAKIQSLSQKEQASVNPCMRTRSQARNRNRRQQQLTTVIVEEPEFPMADNRTMAQMIQAPIEGYEDAIVVPPINANNFELKQPLIKLVQSNKFTGRQDPHNHLRFFHKARTSRSILTWDDLVAKFINQFFPPSKTTYYRNEIITFFQKPNETFNEAWERFKGLLRQCPHHGFSELHQLDTFYNSLNTNDQDALDSAAGGNFLDKMPREGLAIIESKSEVRYSRSRPNDSRAITNAPSSTFSPSNSSFDVQQMAALLEDKMNIRMSRLEKAISEKNATTPATVKAVEEVCVTCGSNHNFNNCPLTRNDFPVFQDNIHQFQQTAAVGNFVQRNPPNLANQIRPPGFNQPNVQSNQGNQSRYQGTNFNSNQNRGGNFNPNRQNNQGAIYQAPPYQPPTNQPLVNQALPPVSQIQGVSKTDFESYAKANDANMNNLQMKLDNFQRNQNDFQRSYNDSQKKQDDFQNLMLGFMQNYHNNSTASTSRPGTLPSQTVTNPRQQINAITTRSGKTLEGPSTPLVPTPVISIPQKEPEQNPETSTEKVQNPNLENTAHVPPPGEEDSIFIEIPKPKAKIVNLIYILPILIVSIYTTIHREDENWIEDALVEMPKFNKWLSSLLRNKEKLEEIAITTVNVECSAIIMNKVPEKLEDPGKFLIPSLTPTRNGHSSLSSLLLTRMGIAEDVVVRVDGFTFLADFVVVNFEPDPRVPIILGRPFLRTAKALIDLYEETLTLRVGKEELVYYADKSEKNKDKNFVHAISIIDFLKDDPFSGSITNTLPPSSSPVKTSDNLEKKKNNVNPLFEENDKDVEIKSSSSFTLTSPEESEFEAYLERDSIPPGINLTLPPALKVSSSNPTSPYLRERRKKIICLLATYLHKKPKLLSRPQEVEEIKIEEDKVSSDFPINTIVMPIRITFDNPIDFNDHFSKPKDFKKDLTVSFDSSESSILPPPLLDSDSPFTAELSASVTLNSLGNEDKRTFPPGLF
ncbi:reverse transcriptase domain-containing protein [Tanacetum coccineum]